MASDDFERIAYAIAISIREAITRAVVAAQGVGARPSIGGRRIVVAGCEVLATNYFERITHAVAIGIREAVACAVVTARGVGARPGVGGHRVVVAG